MKAIKLISIRQPYAEAIVAGEKEIEVRSRMTTFRGRVYVYAAKQPARGEVWDFYREKMGSKIERAKLPRGQVIGSVDIVDCVFDEEYDSWLYILENPKRVAKPFAPMGMPQPCFWEGWQP